MHESYLSLSYTGVDTSFWTSSILYYCGKAFGEHSDIQIEIDYEKKFKNYFISSFWLNLFEFIVRYVYIIYLYMYIIRSSDSTVG